MLILRKIVLGVYLMFFTVGCSSVDDMGDDMPFTNEDGLEDNSE